MEVLITLAIQRVSGSLDAEALLRDRFGLLGRECRGLSFQYRIGFSSAVGLGRGGYGF